MLADLRLFDQNVLLKITHTIPLIAVISLNPAGAFDS